MVGWFLGSVRVPRNKRAPKNQTREVALHTTKGKQQSHCCTDAYKLGGNNKGEGFIKHDSRPIGGYSGPNPRHPPQLCRLPQKSLSRLVCSSQGEHKISPTVKVSNAACTYLLHFQLQWYLGGTFRFQCWEGGWEGWWEGGAEKHFESSEQSGNSHPPTCWMWVTF